MQSIRFILGTIVTLVVLAWTGVQLYAAYTVSSAMYQVNSSIDEAERASQPPVGAYQVENVKGDQALWSGYDALSRIAEPVDERVITFNAYVKLRELLRPGEEKPDADFADVFVNARASAFAEGECARVMKKLASQCLVRYVTAYRVEKGDGVYNIQATLAFVQKDGLGNVKTATQLAYREVRKNLGGQRQGRHGHARRCGAPAREILRGSSARLPQAAQGRGQLRHLPHPDQRLRQAGQRRLAARRRCAILVPAAGGSPDSARCELTEAAATVTLRICEMAGLRRRDSSPF